MNKSCVQTFLHGHGRSLSGEVPSGLVTWTRAITRVCWGVILLFWHVHQMLCSQLHDMNNSGIAIKIQSIAVLLRKHISTLLLQSAGDCAIHPWRTYLRDEPSSLVLNTRGVLFIFTLVSSIQLHLRQIDWISASACSPLRYNKVCGLATYFSNHGPHI